MKSPSGFAFLCFGVVLGEKDSFVRGAIFDKSFAGCWLSDLGVLKSKRPRGRFGGSERERERLGWWVVKWRLICGGTLSTITSDSIG